MVVTNMWQSYTRYPLRDPVIRDIPVSPTESDLKKAIEIVLVPLLQQLGDDQQINGLLLGVSQSLVHR
jgi:hypothetical protein